VDAVGVPVHVAGIQVLVQVAGGRNAGVAEDLLQHLRWVSGLDHERGGSVPQARPDAYQEDGSRASLTHRRITLGHE
jgi:hypothetical protein